MGLGNYSLPTKQETKTIEWRISEPLYSLQDLILAKETEEQVLDVVSYFESKELLFREWGLQERFSRMDGLAVNLYGDSGTGKTVAAHAIVNALHKKLICVDYAEIESKYVGETSKNLTALFQSASENDFAIFFDEADALLSKRVTNMSSATDVSVNQTRSVLLNLLNSYRGVIIFASNFIQNFDVAFLRRIKYHVRFSLPNKALREKLWRMYIPAKMPCRLVYEELAEKTDGASGSDIANAVFTAAVRAAREKIAVIPQNYFEEAIASAKSVKPVERLLSQEEAKEKGLCS